MPRRADQAGFLTTMRQRFQTAVGAWDLTRREMVKDITFCDLNQQWETNDEANRTAAQRPCLTVNQVRQFKQQIVNQQRAARPGPKVTPKGSGTDIDTAEVLEGVLEHIEHPDDRAPAETWIDIGFDNMVTCGIGWLRWYTRYRPKSRLQEIVIDGIENALGCYIDPTFRQPDSMDKRYAFVPIDYTPEEFEKKYKKTATATKQMVSDLQSLGDSMPNWLPEGQIRVVEYFYLETDDVPMVEVEDPASLTGARVMTKADMEAYNEENPGAPLTVIGEHSETETTCFRAVCTGSEVLEGNKDKTAGAEIVADGIPIIPIFGDMAVLNGKRHVAGMVRYMRDPAKMINFLVSALAENIALMPKPKWLAEISTIEDFKDVWKDANNANYSSLPWSAKAGPDGTPLPPPQMLVNEPPIAAIVEGLQVFTTMIQATASLHDPSLGKQKSDQSGRAVALLQQQGQIGTLNWQDNLTRSLKALYRQIVKAIPRVYDVPQVFQILRRTDQSANVVIHAGNPPGLLQPGHPPTSPKDAGLAQQFPDLQNVEKIYDLADLEFAVDVDTGPNFNTRRQENQAWLLEVAKIMPPQQLAVITPLLAEYSDAPVSKQVASILKKVVGTELYPPDNQQPIPPEAQQAITQMQQMLQQLTQELNAKNEYIQTEQAKHEAQVKTEQVKQAGALDLARVNNAAKIAAAWITATKGGTVLQEQRDEQLATGLELVHDAHQASLDRAHEVGMALLDHGHKVLQAQQGADTAADQSTQDHAEATAAADQGHQHAQEQAQQAAELQPEPEPEGQS